MDHRIDINEPRRIPSKTVKTIPIAVACIALSLTVGGCRKQTSTRYTPVGPGCPASELPPGAITKAAFSGGFTGDTRVRTYFMDGRVVERTFRGGSREAADVEEISWTIPPARMKKLEADLVATGVFSVPSGCWRRPEPIPDGGSTSLVIRHGGKTYSYAGDGETPAVVDRASAVVHELSSSFQSVEAAARLEHRIKHADGGLETDL